MAAAIEENNINQKSTVMAKPGCPTATHQEKKKKKIFSPTRKRVLSEIINGRKVSMKMAKIIENKYRLRKIGYHNQCLMSTHQIKSVKSRLQSVAAAWREIIGQEESINRKRSAASAHEEKPSVIQSGGPSKIRRKINRQRKKYSRKSAHQWNNNQWRKWRKCLYQWKAASGGTSAQRNNRRNIFPEMKINNIHRQK